MSRSDELLNKHKYRVQMQLWEEVQAQSEWLLEQFDKHRMDVSYSYGLKFLSVSSICPSNCGHKEYNVVNPAGKEYRRAMAGFVTSFYGVWEGPGPAEIRVPEPDRLDRIFGSPQSSSRNESATQRRIRQDREHRIQFTNFVADYDALSQIFLYEGTHRDTTYRFTITHEAADARRDNLPLPVLAREQMRVQVERNSVDLPTSVRTLSVEWSLWRQDLYNAAYCSDRFTVYVPLEIVGTDTSSIINYLSSQTQRLYS